MYKNERRSIKAIKIIGFGILAIAIMSLFGFVVKWLWNGLMPDIFGLKEITYWQGVGLLVLGRILLGGFGGQSDSGRNHKRRKEYHDVHESEKVSTSTGPDALYEKWWASEGEQAFEAYLDKEND